MYIFFSRVYIHFLIWEWLPKLIILIALLFFVLCFWPWKHCCIWNSLAMSEISLMFYTCQVTGLAIHGLQTGEQTVICIAIGWLFELVYFSVTFALVIMLLVLILFSVPWIYMLCIFSVNWIRVFYSYALQKCNTFFSLPFSSLHILFEETIRECRKMCLNTESTSEIFKTVHSLSELPLFILDEVGDEHHSFQLYAGVHSETKRENLSYVLKHYLVEDGWSVSI